MSESMADIQRRRPCPCCGCNTRSQFCVFSLDACPLLFVMMMSAQQPVQSPAQLAIRKTWRFIDISTGFFPSFAAVLYPHSPHICGWPAAAASGGCSLSLCVCTVRGRCCTSKARWTWSNYPEPHPTSAGEFRLVYNNNNCTNAAHIKRESCCCWIDVARHPAARRWKSCLCRLRWLHRQLGTKVFSTAPSAL